MIIIGLCGGSGSGKTRVAECLRAAGISTLDTDALYHEMISSDSPCSRELIRGFGEEIALPGGGINRSKLGELVFSSKEQASKLSLLNAITHKYILQEIKKWLDKQRQTNAFAVCLDAPVLFESGLDRECDMILVVVADPEIRINRLCTRDGISPEKARDRINSQLPDEFLTAHADFVIENSGEPLEPQIRAFLSFLKNYQ